MQTCTLDSSRMCTFTTDHLSYFGTVRTTSTSITSPTVRSSGGGGGSLRVDFCPNGDTSSSYYDRTCGTENLTGTTNTYAKKIEEVKKNLKRGSTSSLLESAAKKLAEEVIHDIQNKYSTPNSRLIEISKVLDIAKNLRNTEKDLLKRNFLNRFIRYIESYKNQLKALLPKTEEVIPQEKVIPYTPTKPVNGPILQDTPYTGIYQYTTVSHAVNIHGTKAYGTDNLVGNIYRNERVITVESSNDGWSFIVFRDGKAGYIRTRFLRDATREDLIRDGVLDAKYGEQRTITVAKSVYMRKSPYYGAKILGVLRNGEKVTKLDALNKFTEVQTQDERQGFVKSRYVK